MPKLSNEDLIIMARTLKEQQKMLEEQLRDNDKEQQKLLARMKKRKVEAIEIDGWRLNGVWGTDMTIDEPGLLAALTPKQRKAILKEVVDRKRLSQAVQAKVISLKTLKRHSGTKDRKPYYRVTKLKKKGKK